jgi:alpha-tubulin suppressor-like RCC1 family protein
MSSFRPWFVHSTALACSCAVAGALATGCNSGDKRPATEAVETVAEALTCPPGTKEECVIIGGGDANGGAHKVCSCVALSAPPPPPPPQPGSIANAGNCVDVASYVAGTTPAATACAATKLSQAWGVDFLLKTIESSQDDARCLQVSDPTVSDGSLLTLADCVAGAPNQTFPMSSVQLRSNIDGKGMVANATSGGLVTMSGSPTAWQLPLATSTISAPGTNYCLELPGGSTAEFTHVTNSPCTGALTQQWRIGAGHIMSLAANMCLTEDTGVGTVYATPCASAANEWSLTTTIPSLVKSSMCVTADPAGVLAMHACSGAATQSWTIEGTAFNWPYVPPAGARTIGGGPLSTLIIDGTGTEYGWGDNTHGQLGGQGGGYFAARVGPLANATALTGGNGFNCDTTTASFQDLWCIGTDAQNQLPTSTSTDSYTPVPAGITRIGTVKAGANFACALSTAGAVNCWGTVLQGDQPYAVGTPPTVPNSGTQMLPVFSGAAEIAVGANHVCARMTADGSVQCWGSNTWGQAGGGTSLFVSAAQTVLFPAGFSARQLFAGDDASCARGADDSVWCWGSNGKGSFATGKAPAYRLFEPTMIPALSGMAHMWLGQDYSCGNHGDGTLECWGDNTDGQLGDGTQVARTTMATVPGLTNVADVVISHGAPGPWRTCALLRDGSVRCWGSNADDALGTTAVALNANALSPVVSQVAINLPPPPPPPQ